MQTYCVSVDPDTFRSLLGRFASGVTVVTVADDAGRDYGITITAFTSLSLEPPLVLFCVDHAASAHAALRAAVVFAVNVLSETQEPLARHFAAVLPDRFGGIGYTRGLTGAALLDDVVAHLECRKRDELEGGDHTIFIGEVESGTIRAERPLLYYRGGYAQLER